MLPRPADDLGNLTCLMIRSRDVTTDPVSHADENHFTARWPEDRRVGSRACRSGRSPRPGRRRPPSAERVEDHQTLHDRCRSRASEVCPDEVASEPDGSRSPGNRCDQLQRPGCGQPGMTGVSGGCHARVSLARRSPPGGRWRRAACVLAHGRLKPARSGARRRLALDHPAATFAPCLDGAFA